MSKTSDVMALNFRDKGISGTQIDVLCGDLVIATVYKGTLSGTAGGTGYWNWTFYFTARPPGFELHGTAASREIACLAVERNWEAWLKAARLRDEET